MNRLTRPKGAESFRSTVRPVEEKENVRRTDCTARAQSRLLGHGAYTYNQSTSSTYQNETRRCPPWYVIGVEFDQAPKADAFGAHVLLLAGGRSWSD